MEIRQATKADAGILAQIVSQANAPVAKAFGLNQENAPSHPSFCTPAWIETGMARGECYFLLEAGKEAAGCVAYESPEPAVAFLNRLAVRPRDQGKGLGRRLVRHIINLAARQGKMKISIGIIEANEDLRRWYETLGFVPAGTKRFAHLPFDVLFMAYDLAGEKDHGR